MEGIKEVGRLSSSQNSRVIDADGISYAITNGDKDGMPKIIEREVPTGENDYEPIVLGWVRDKKGNVVRRPQVNVANCVTSGKRDNTQNYIIEPLRIAQATDLGYVEIPVGAVYDGSYPESKTRRGRLQDGGKVTPTITANGEPLNYYEGVTEKGYRIRKLTERECFRLMGVSDEDIDKIQDAKISRTQQHKLAGNSIVVDVLEQFFRKMFVETGQESEQLYLF